MSFRIINGNMYPIQTVKTSNESIKAYSKNQEKNSFNDILNKEINKNKDFIISKHAEKRLRDRNIVFNEEDMKLIGDGINKAREKGSRESVIVYKDIALVTSITNKTIITAVEKNSSDNVFTNIDSVVLL